MRMTLGCGRDPGAAVGPMGASSLFGCSRTSLTGHQWISVVYRVQELEPGKSISITSLMTGIFRNSFGMELSLLQPDWMREVASFMSKA